MQVCEATTIPAPGHRVRPTRRGSTSTFKSLVYVAQHSAYSFSSDQVSSSSGQAVTRSPTAFDRGRATSLLAWPRPKKKRRHQYVFVSVCRRGRANPPSAGTPLLPTVDARSLRRLAGASAVDASRGRQVRPIVGPADKSTADLGVGGATVEVLVGAGSRGDGACFRPQRAARASVRD